MLRLYKRNLSWYLAVVLFISVGNAQNPDYSDLKNWAAHPIIEDEADNVPSSDMIDRQNDSGVDVFFLHPTTYTGPLKKKKWNASIDDKKIADKTDESTIKYQASIFNGAGKVYAPRYRQAHLRSYFTKDREQAKEAFAIAYTDVKSAFEYYLEHFNEGRPIIIASHSQGAQHAVQLIQEFFDGRPLQEKLVIAYLVGMPVPADAFQNIPVCQNEEEVGCYCSWRTYLKGHFPKYHMKNNNLVVVNPLTWSTEEKEAEPFLNKGAVLKNFEKIWVGLADAEIRNGVLWTTKPKFPGSFLIRTKNYHIADYNLYWVNVRENARLRADKYLDTLARK